MSEYGHERWMKVLMTGSALQVSERQFPSLYRLYLGCVERLGVSPTPPLYVTSGGLNAWTAGIERPYLVLTSSLVSAFDDRELEFVIGHELGHVRLEHVLYQSLARSLPTLARLIPGIGPFLTRPILVAVLEWSRRAELSCDRFGHLAAQDNDAGVRTHIKLAGAPYRFYDQLDTEAFLAQYDAFAALDHEKLSFVYRLLMEMQLSHPWLVERAHLLHTWVQSGEPARLLEEQPWEAEADAPTTLCPACKAPTLSTDRFCAQCGAPLAGGPR